MIYKESKDYVAMSNIITGYVSVLNTEAPALPNTTVNTPDEQKEDFFNQTLARIEVYFYFILFSNLAQHFLPRVTRKNSLVLLIALIIERKNNNHICTHTHTSNTRFEHISL